MSATLQLSPFLVFAGIFIGAALMYRLLQSMQPPQPPMPMFPMGYPPMGYPPGGYPGAGNVAGCMMSLLLVIFVLIGALFIVVKMGGSLFAPKPTERGDTNSVARRGEYPPAAPDEQQPMAAYTEPRQPGRVAQAYAGPDEPAQLEIPVPYDDNADVWGEERFYLQTGSFVDADKARAKAAALTDEVAGAYAVCFCEVETENGTSYRVLIGPFPSRKRAAAYRRNRFPSAIIFDGTDFDVYSDI